MESDKNSAMKNSRLSLISPDVEYDLYTKISHSLSPNLQVILEKYKESQKGKQCHCKNSRCLKLYCECFASGVYCQQEVCQCQSCHNTKDFEETRRDAIRNILLRNESAFRPKIQKLAPKPGLAQHNKGCKCRKSACLKKYCECFQAKVCCSENCACLFCENFEGSSRRVEALKHHCEKEMFSVVDSIEFSAKENGEREGSKSLFMNLSSNNLRNCPKRIRIDDHAPFALKAYPRSLEQFASKQGKRDVGHDDYKYSSLAGLIEQTVIESTTIDIMEDLFEAEKEFDTSTCKKRRAHKTPGLHSKQTSFDGNNLTCSEEPADISYTEGSYEIASRVYAKEERAVLVRISKILQELAHNSFKNGN